MLLQITTIPNLQIWILTGCLMFILGIAGFGLKWIVDNLKNSIIEVKDSIKETTKEIKGYADQLTEVIKNSAIHDTEIKSINDTQIDMLKRQIQIQDKQHEQEKEMIRQNNIIQAVNKLATDTNINLGDLYDDVQSVKRKHDICKNYKPLNPNQTK